MKKTNLITFLILGFFILGASVYRMYMPLCAITHKEITKENKESVAIESKKVTSKRQETKNEEEKKENIKRKMKKFSMKDTLFIGDSRTVGLMEYGTIEGSDFFCMVGMSVFNIFDDVVSVCDFGKVTLSELLINKKYDKIYIMLGLNEMGYRFDNIIKKYKELITFIKQKEPNKSIFLQANLHVTAERSNNDDTFNNHAINKLNTALSKIAQEENLYFLDANCLFDDENGNLSSDKSSDSTHLYAKYYEVWGNWIIEQSALLTKGE